MTEEANWRRKLEADARAGREAAAQRDELAAQRDEFAREVAFRRAGIDIDRGPGQLLYRSYDGDLTPEAVMATAEAYGIHQAGIPVAVQQAYGDMSTALSGGAPSGGYAPDFNDELDAIPMVKDGQYNPDYVNQVIGVARKAAAAQGRPFEVSGGQVTWQNGAAGPVPVTTPFDD